MWKVVLREAGNSYSGALLCLAIRRRQLATVRYPDSKMTIPYRKRRITAEMG